MADQSDDPIQAAMAPLYERLGAAVVTLQAFEHSIAYLIALAMESHVADETGQVQAASLERSSGLTLGTLLTTLSVSVPIQELEIKSLRLALKLRNRIIHHWLPDNLERIKTPAGRADSIERLNSAISALRIADSIVTEHIDQHTTVRLNDPC